MDRKKKTDSEGEPVYFSYKSDLYLDYIAASKIAEISS
ncbi:hypothetical protein VCRA2123O444_90124 [Vibrio crassostreae]|nr:hypothetical protein VCRA2119O430_100043 [Vibrio crassostreae]CAK1713133.1 hypothetical protein VCRA2117O428_110043 [Vibrio crassostreae]CAK1716629.1 hypothetical protein VCRA2113O418_110043 [Vibrio crassostreae]CAK1724288.1 hypothetical protein VCRA2118O429_110122 [Vibrio crassostreae]CAK1724592.1 hypothetical protein VCRA2114O421_110122 [Vibrio crassostreae]